MRRLLRSLQAALIIVGFSISSIVVSPASSGLDPHEIAAIVAQSSIHDSSLPAFPSPEPSSVASPTALPSPVGGGVPIPPPTATTNLFAKFISPLDGGSISRGYTDVTVVTTLGAQTELTLNGQIVPHTQIGKMSTFKDNTVQYVYYGLPIDGGESGLSVVSLGANGLRGEPVSIKLSGPSKAVTVSIVPQGGFVADGKTQRFLRISGLDRFGKSSSGTSLVHVSVSGVPAVIVGGTLYNPGSIASVVGKHDTSDTIRDFKMGPDGFVDVPVIPGTTPGILHVHVLLDGISGDADVSFVTQIRPALVVGVGQAGIGSIPSVIGLSPTDTNGSNAMRGRIAAFGTGSIGKKTAFTFAYDSSQPLSGNANQGAGFINPLNGRYETYGDGSVITQNALSEGRIYARLDSGTSSLSYGEFTPNIGPSQNAQNGTYGIQNGFDLHLRTPRFALSGFAGRNGYAFGRLIVPLSGLASTTQNLNQGILVGSDIVNLVVLDKVTGAVLSETPLLRNVDYSIDYITGSFRFLNVPLPFDDHLNPQSVMIQYQYGNGESSAELNGGRLSGSLDKNGKIVLGIGYLNQVTGGSNYSLLQEDLGIALQGGSLNVVHAQSFGLANNVSGNFLPVGSQTGSSLQVNYKQAIKANTFAFSYQEATPNFLNPFGGYTAAGLREYDGSITHVMSGGKGLLTLIGNSTHSVSTFTSDVSTRIGLTWTQTVSKILAFNIGLTKFNEQQSGPSVSATPSAGAQATVGLKYTPSSKTEIDLERDFALSGQSIFAPSGTRIQAKTIFGDKTVFFGIAQFNDSPSQPMSGGNLTAVAGAMRSFAFGIDHPIGKSFDIGSRYEFGSSQTGGYAYSLEEAKKRFMLSKNLLLDLDVQEASASLNQPGFTLYGATLGYSRDTFHLAGSVQDRTGATGGLTFQTAASGDIGHGGISVLANMYANRSPLNDSTSARVGIAWRPTTGRGSALLDYNQQTGSSLFGETSQVFSAEGAYDITPTTSLSGRFAYKLDGSSSYYMAHTALYGLNVNHRLGQRFDIGLEGIGLSVPGISNTTSFGLATELNYRLTPTTRVGVGYAFTSLADPSLSRAPKKGIYLNFTTVFDNVFGWGKH